MVDTYKVKDVNGLRLVKGSLPIDKASDILLSWAKQGFTEACSDLKVQLKCDYVTGSPDAINAARARFGLSKKVFRTRVSTQ